MYIRNFIFTIFIATIFSGCSAKTKDFFENLYSQTEVRSATQEDYATIKAATNAPIIKEKTPKQRKKSSRYSSESSNIYTATGKIIDADYDEDVNLYIYAFLKSGTALPISFYYDKDLRPIGDIVTITVKDNFLTSISKKGKSSREIKRTKEKIRRWKKRKKSNIQTPYEEKINTL